MKITMKLGLRPHVFNNNYLDGGRVMINDLSKGLNVLRKCLNVLFTLIILSSFVNVSHSGDISAALQELPHVIDNSDDPSVCQSKDIRNTVDMFAELQGCRVIEGFVQIVLIDSAEVSDYANISFPELHEITGYLLLYRVQGLRSLGKLFPNLSVIRGNTLFLNYALVVYEMIQLQEIGLISLTHILRGAVYFAKNPMLCFVETVDWDIIAPHGKGEHHIVGNKKSIECPMCPKRVNQNESCPLDSYSGEPLCWNIHHCQRSCPDHCYGACYLEGECCHPLCLGGCSDKSVSSCFVCKHFLFHDECVEKCPEGTHEYLNRRCVTEEECRDLPKPRERHEDRTTKDRPWKPFGGKCLLECPSGYVEKEINVNGEVRLGCEKCKGICKKICPGTNVDSIASIQTLHGCTSINGALEIQIRGSNMVKELEENLNTIEEIDDYLKVVRSYPLISLNFLSGLKEIHGYKLENFKYALVVLDNQNLVDLWDWKHRSTGLKIDNGRLFFHFNPLLCYEKIDDFRKKANLSVHSDLEIARNSNGDKTACNVETIDLVVYKKTSVAALIMWKQFENHDPRTLLGYVVYYIEAPYKNVSIYDSRDACGDDGWRVADVSVQDKSDNSEQSNISAQSEYDNSTARMNEINHLLSKLKPYTQYAVYVKTYTIATETRGAQSPLLYFRTDPDTPSEPRSITMYSNSSSEIVLNWKPPSHPNGNVTHYIIKAVREPDDQDDIDQQNYCLESLVFPDNKRTPIKKPNLDQTSLTSDEDAPTENESCSCSRKLVDNKLREKEIYFEDYLQNYIYVKRNSSLKEKREISKSSPIPFDVNSNTIFGSYDEEKNPENENHTVDGKYEKYRAVVYGGKHSLLIRKLKHFSKYRISIQACRELEKDEDVRLNNKCSQEGIIAGRTWPKKNCR